MLKEYQVEEIALALYEFREDEPLDIQRDPHLLPIYEAEVRFVTEKVIAKLKPHAEQDRRSFIAVGKYIGVEFTSETDVVSEVFKKLDEILAVFREHSQEIAITQHTKTLINLLERYEQQKES